MPEWVAVCEADADFRATAGVIDRLIGEEIEWAGGNTEVLRSWREIGGDAFLRWTTVRRLAAEKGVVVHGKFGDRGLRGEWLQARKALVLIDRLVPGATAVLLSRDDDGKGRRDAYEDARRHHASQVVCLALAVPELEAWQICAFAPADEREAEILEQERSTLGRDPRIQTERLNAGRETDENGRAVKNSTKRILRALTADRGNRREEGLQKEPVSSLVSRGEGNGLGSFIGEVRSLLLPQVGTDG